MAFDHEEKRKRAEARCKVREQQQIDAPRAVRDYKLAQQAVREKTLRLRALRLSRDMEKPA